jgi:hypothetical protein
LWGSLVLRNNDFWPCFEFKEVLEELKEITEDVELKHIAEEVELNLLIVFLVS